MKTTTVRIPEELDRELSEYASRKGISKNQAMKKAIRDLVESKRRCQNDPNINP